MSKAAFHFSRLLTGAALLASMAAHAQIVTNGSFEAVGPDFSGAGSYCYLGYAPLDCVSVPSWTGAFPVIQAGSGAWGSPNGQTGWDVSFGNVLIGLQNISFAEQTLSSVTAGQFTLTWMEAGRNYSAPNNTTSNYKVLFGGQTLATTVVSFAQGWTSRSVTFNATGPGVLRFEGLDTTGDHTTFIDKVAVTAVPEPTGMLLAVMAVAGLFVVRRRSV